MKCSRWKSNKYEKFSRFFHVVSQRCNFHQTIEEKQQWSQQEKEAFEKDIIEFMANEIREGKCGIDFIGLVFTKINWSNIFKKLHNRFPHFDFTRLIMDFTNCTFIENVRFDDIQCDKLILKDCKFLDGGGIKSRDRENSLHIRKLQLRFLELDGDFVVDLGKYADDNGNIVIDEKGKIEEIEFENPQKGSGRIFFIGLKDKGNFRNRVLDKVIFENCDLSECCFLNAKIDNADFRNVIFRKLDDLDIVFLRADQIDRVGILSFVLMVVFGVFVYLLQKNFTQNVNIFIMVMLIFSLLLTGLFMFSLSDAWFTKFLTFFKKIGILKDKEGVPLVAYHVGVCDEYYMHEKINNLQNKDSQELKQQSENLKALAALYKDFAQSFRNKDIQLSGEFYNSYQHINSIIYERSIENFIDKHLQKAHHLINGNGQRWFRALFWIIIAILFSTLVNLYVLQFSKDYVLNNNQAPYFLQEINKNHKKIEFSLSTVAFYKTLSTISYPLPFESKNWFKNETQKAVLFSFLEAISFWILFIAFVKAVWNRIRF